MRRKRQKGWDEDAACLMSCLAGATQVVEVAIETLCRSSNARCRTQATFRERNNGSAAALIVNWWNKTCMYNRARWDYQWLNLNSRHVYPYVKLNFKANLFSCIFFSLRTPYFSKSDFYVLAFSPSKIGPKIAPKSKQINIVSGPIQTWTLILTRNPSFLGDVGLIKVVS